MSYFQETEEWLTAIIMASDDEDEEAWLSRVKKQIKDKILESYRNGQKAGLPPQKPGTPGEEKRQPVPPKRKFWPPRAGSRSRPQ